MADITDPKQAGERLLTFEREGRLAQFTWNDEQDGREVACLLGAAAGISDEDKCPTSLMPKWVAHVLPGLFDGQTANHAFAFARRWGEAMIRPEWVRIDWDAVRSEWLTYVVAQASEAAQRAASTDDSRAVLSAARSAAAAAWAADAVASASAPAYAAYYAARDAARDDQADALMDAIEKAMEVARG